MSDCFTFQAIDDIAIVTFTERPALADIFLAIDRIATTDCQQLRLWDFSKKGFNFSKDELRQIAIYGKSRLATPARLAIVAGELLSFGLSREFEAYRDEDDLETMVFRDPDAARTWLEEGRPLLMTVPR